MIQRGLRCALMLGGFVTAAAMLTACGGGDSSNASAASPTQAGPAQATATPPPEARIQVADNSFTPAELTIKAGTKVVWEWSGMNPHSVLLSGRASDTMTGSGKFERVFDTPGTTFPYQCGVHGAAMSGKIIVQ